jgi:hypothetical protein
MGRSSRGLVRNYTKHSFGLETANKKLHETLILDGSMTATSHSNFLALTGTARSITYYVRSPSRSNLNLMMLLRVMYPTRHHP